MNQDDQASPAPMLDDLLERYLDGLMPTAEHAAFEAQIAADPSLAAQVAAHRRLADALGHMYDAKSLAAPASPQPASFPLATARPRSNRLVRIAGIAAAAAIAIGAVIFFLVPRPQPSEVKVVTDKDFQDRNRKYMVGEYAKQVDAGFKPHEVCNTDQQFAKWTQEAFGQSLKPVHPAPGSGAPPEPVLAGWSKGNVFSSYSGLLLARVDGKPVMVVMDKAPDRMIPQDDPTGTPRIFRRKVNDVWMIEVTPLDQPRVITNIEAGPQ